MAYAKAVFNLTNRYIYYGSQDAYILRTAFTLYDANGNYVERSPAESFSSIAVNGNVLYQSSPGAIDLTFKKHINSTTVAEDSSMTLGVKNTYVEDLSNVGRIFITGNITHPTAGDFALDGCILFYCPAMFPPSIPIERLRNTLRSSGSDYYSIFTNATINKFSPIKPDKISPFGVGECLGYAPNYLPVQGDQISNVYTVASGYPDNSYIVNTPYYLNPSETIIQYIRVGSTQIPNPTQSGTIGVLLYFGANDIDYQFMVDGVWHTFAQSHIVTLYRSSPLYAILSLVKVGNAVSFNVTNESTSIDTGLHLRVVATYEIPTPGQEFPNIADETEAYLNTPIAHGDNIIVKNIPTSSVPGAILRIVRVDLYDALYTLASATILV